MGTVGGPPLYPLLGLVASSPKRTWTHKGSGTTFTFLKEGGGGGVAFI